MPPVSPMSPMSPTIYCVPLLHAALEGPVSDGLPIPASAVRLWPGLPNMPAGFWAASSLPFTPAAAQDCIKQLEALSEAALSGVPMQTLAQMDSAPDAQKKRQELHDIAVFAQSGEAALPKAVEPERALRAAQKSLLWAWLLEEKVLEVKKIMSAYTSNASHVMDSLCVEEDDDDKALSLLAALDRNLDSTTVMLPPWPMVLENVALFLPEGALLLVDNSGDMANDLRDRLNFAPAPDSVRALWQPSASGLANDADTLLETARAPLWQALNKEAHCDEQPWRAKEFVFVLTRPRAGKGDPA